MVSTSTLSNLGIYAVLVAGLCGAFLGVAYVLGQRSKLRQATIEPYESGIVSTGGAHYRLSSKFYLVAVFFVIFDLEAVFIFAWALVAREAGWTGYIELLIFVTILLAALVYLWRLGALDWNPGRIRNQQRRAQFREQVRAQNQTE